MHYPSLSTYLTNPDHDPDNWEANSYLFFKDSAYSSTPPSDIYFYNSGLNELSSYLPNGCQKGEKYIFRYRGILSDANGAFSSSWDTVSSSASWSAEEYRHLTVAIQEYTSEKNKTGSEYFSRDSVAQGEDNWIEYTMTCQKSFTREEIFSKHIGLFINPRTFTQNQTGIWVESLQFFPYVEDDEGERINPGDLGAISVATVYEYYYNHGKYSKTKDPDKIKYVYTGKVGETPSELTDLLTPNYIGNFAKIRSISIKNSNRFNILQEIAETFECWLRFSIEHDSTGKIVYDTTTGQPHKTVKIVKEVGRDVGIGFLYGTDLKGITRDIQSDQIVTKTIVIPNSNEYAINGFCTIARSTENYPKTNFLLNFDYYINQGLLDSGEVNKDLYLSSGGIGYFYNLHNLNSAYDDNAEVLAQRKTELTKQEANLKVYEQYLTSIQIEQNNIKSDLYQLTGVAVTESWSTVKAKIKEYKDNENIVSKFDTFNNNKKSLANYKQMVKDLTTAVASLTTTVDVLEKEQEEYIEQMEALDSAFYKKYARFLQEGTWIDEQYIDDNLYYLDAQKTAYTAGRPQISYNISVIRISSLPDFENKVFRCGDISFVQDPEFFGYTYINGVKTPYKEKVLISEITSNFDSPQNDSFKVQNYKTQFEDLFQRVTASTQSLQYSSGGYARAASVVDTNGTIKAETLQNSIALNEQLVYSARNEAIIQDSTGITVADTTNPNKKTKITSGGVFITTDGGTTWKNAVRGDGIATEYLTAGSINANQITIYDGDYSTFRWDNTGINAYDYSTNTEGASTGVNFAKFVRFDHYGIYGLEDVNREYVPASEASIWNDAKFGMTWRGFFVKNKRGTHTVEVSSENDVQVTDSNGVARVKVGELEANGAYGMRIKDATGATVMETVDSGTLWLKNALHIGTTSTDFYASIGYLDAVESTEWIIPPNAEGSPDSQYRRSLDINKKFVVWEDGTMYAKDGYFEGTINALNGYFEGTINATNGSFTGELNATSGQISNTLNVNGILDVSNGEGYSVQIGTLPEGRIINVNDNFIVNADGSITANSGSFNGSIVADSGLIGGFNIDQGKLTSVATYNEYIEFTGDSFASDVIYYEYNSGTNNYDITTDSTPNSEKTYYTLNTEPYITLDGTEGQIIAKKIQLGIGATIEQYIELGDAKLYNPTANSNNYILTAGNVSLTDQGVLRLNEISFDGETSTIRGDSFLITPTEAVFHNITATGKITTAVFEQNRTQLMGGITIFKPSYKIKSYENATETISEVSAERVKLTLDLSDNEAFIGSVGDYIKLIDSDGAYATATDYQIVAISEDKTVVTLNDAYAETNKLFSFIVVGQDGALMIGVNSTDSSTPIQKRGISIAEYDSETGNSKLKAFLGELNGEVGDGIPDNAGYGLYSNNVFLTGSLITRINTESITPTYAGVNTLNGVTSILDSKGDPIVFWAGATSNEEESIQTAPFQVTDGGHLYASNGKFTGSIIVDADITGSHIYGADIYTARIHGYKNNDEPWLNEKGELSFYDAVNGIVFYRNIDETTNEELLRLTTTGFIYKGLSNFINFDDENSLVNASFTKANIGNFVLEENSIKNDNLQLDFSLSSFGIKVGDSYNLTIDTETINNEVDSYLKQNIYYGSTLRYVKALNSSEVEVGYDLYVGG